MGKKLGIFAAVDPANHSWVETNGHVNPFNKNVLEPHAITTTVTSIPSPYARMHLFELGFRQLANGSAGVSEEIRKCVAHCLDVYELLFRCRTSEHLRINGIAIEMHRYQDTTNVGKDTSEYKYLDALCTFRNSYIRRYRIPVLDATGNKVLDQKGNDVTQDDTTLFKVFFTISKGHELIAATSPFTGFYVKEDPIEISVDGKLYFAEKELDDNGNRQWKGFEDRDIDFQEFLYKLVRYLVNDKELAKISSFKDRYADFWLYIDKKTNPANKGLWNQRSFAETYPDFDFSGLGSGDYGFPIFTKNSYWNTLPNNQKVYVIPNEYDSCALKYMIAPEESANFRLTKEDYKKDILKRLNPINNLPLPWVSVDDFLDDTLNIIQGEINNDSYFCVKNDSQDEDAGAEYQVLPPLKSRFFEFFTIDDLITNGENGSPLVKFALQHHQDMDGNTNCLFTIKIPYQKNGVTHYLSLSKAYDNDHCRTGIGLELGIYPFFKTPANVDDFYRVVCYASNSMNCTDLELVRLKDGYITNSDILDSSKKPEYIKKSYGVNDVATALDSKIFYYALDGTFVSDNIGLAPHEDVSFDLLKLKYDIKCSGSNINKELIVVPLMKTVTLNPTAIRIAIDLGTSNTYMCYAQGGADPQPYETAHSNIGEAHFVKLGKVVSDSPTTLAKDKYDMGGLYRLTQRCELIPSYFQEGPEGYHFPVPSALNIKNTTSAQLQAHGISPLSTLFNVNIPFSYYEEGTRSFNGNPIDDVRSNFKWFTTSELEKQAESMLYAEQLCLMIRSNLLARDRSLNNVELYFTYPLSFDGNAKGFYQKMWRRIYAKFFGKTEDVAFMANPLQNIDNINQVHWDTESRTPLFSDKALLTQAVKIISADIGGGSTDVMIYDSTVVPNKEMCFSFKFAGNDLFCSDVLNSQNVWYKEILSQVLPKATSGNLGGLTQKKAVADDNGRDAVQLMNKCFSDDRLNKQVIGKFDKAIGSSLLLTLHNSAIIYSMADLCRSLGDENWIPNNLFFSGNGSKLLFLNDTGNVDRNPDQTLQNVSLKIFGAMFPDKKARFNGVNIKKSDDPKAATAKGVIFGLNAGKSVGNGNVEHWVNYGQKVATLYRVNRPGQDNPNGELKPLDKKDLVTDYNGEKKIYNSVIDNVKEFLGIYFSEVVPFFPMLANEFVYNEKSEEEQIEGKRNINYYLNVSNDSFRTGYQNGLSAAQGNQFTESLFFSVISQIILDLCKSL